MPFVAQLEPADDSPEFPLEVEPSVCLTANEPEIGACGLPLEPLDKATIQAWTAEIGTITRLQPDDLRGAQMADFDDEDEDLGGEPLPVEEEEDEFDDFDDIDDDDFDDEFDDDFEEELDDDYEIEIEDEISAEFGLSGVDDEPDDLEVIEPGIDIELDGDDDDIDAVEDFGDDKD